jgi:hypothetical protein
MLRKRLPWTRKDIRRAVELALLLSYGTVAMATFIKFWVSGPMLLYEGNFAIRTVETMMAVGIMVFAVKLTVDFRRGKD